MDGITGLYDKLFEPIKRKGRAKTKKSRPSNSRRMARLSRIALKAPEVMVKVSGTTKGSQHLSSHLDYITRNGKLEGENEFGQPISGRQDVKALHKDWLADGSSRRRNSRESINMVLSMPAGTPPASVLAASRAFAEKTFADNHQYLLVQHTDTKHPHCHLTIKALGIDGKRLNPRKADLQEWREQFAGELRTRGVVAEATPRFIRGVTKKATKQPILHMVKKGRSLVLRQQIKEAIEDLRADRSSEKPWKAALHDRREGVVSAWSDISQELQKGGDTKLASIVSRFINDFPDISTRRDDMQKQAVDRIKGGRDLDNEKQRER